jgi:hypothetical protein
LSSAFYQHFEERDRPKLLSQTAAFMPRRAKIGEVFSTKVAWLAIVRVTLRNPATSESRRLTKPPRHVGRSPNLPRRVPTGLPLASLEHAGIKASNFFTDMRSPVLQHDIGGSRGEMLAGVDRDHLSGHVVRSIPLPRRSPAWRRAKQQNQIRRSSTRSPYPHSQSVEKPSAGLSRA